VAKKRRAQDPTHQLSARTSTSGRDKRPALIAGVAVVLALLAIAIYAQTGAYSFVDLDDTGYVVTNPHVTTGLTPDNVRWALT
jgi:S1-C subfamily serine protease